MRNANDALFMARSSQPHREFTRAIKTGPWHCDTCRTEFPTWEAVMEHADAARNLEGPRE